MEQSPEEALLVQQCFSVSDWCWGWVLFCTDLGPAWKGGLR